MSLKKTLPPHSQYAIRTRCVCTVAISYLLLAAPVFRPGNSLFFAKVTLQGNQNLKEEITMEHNMSEYYGLLRFYAVCFIRQTRRFG